MPGFLGGSSGGSSGTGGEISFPKEFIDPVTKLRVSQPENLIDTDFEYGLQPTKWETVELINNTPSFFSKSGDTTIPNIIAVTTNLGTREITVTTSLDHGIAVGIPIQVTGTKSVTADGSYIVNSIPNTTTFTYLCKANQPATASIEDLYTSIITGEFFQGSQLRISDSSGIVTNDANISRLTVQTESSHGFKVNTPFYFLNLNSTISQEFPASNTVAKSFDSTNSATAQTFDGSNTLSSIEVDWSNSATIGGVTSTINSVNTAANTITVGHSTETFAGRPLGTPLYYSVSGGSGYFLNNPRGVVFLKTIAGLGSATSTFEVSEIPNGPTITVGANIAGTFQLANEARTFAGNNLNELTQTSLTILKGDAQVFDAANSSGTTGTKSSAYSGGIVTVTNSTPLDWYQGTMVFYNTTGSVPTGLANNTTYFIDEFFQSGVNTYKFTLRPLPNQDVITSISGGTGTETFKQIGISLDKDIFHVKDNGFTDADMLEYEFPAGQRFGVADAEQIKNFYFIQTRYDQHNFTVNQTTGDLTPKTIAVTVDRGVTITPTTVTPVGLTAPIVYSILSGTLPTGLSFSTSTGVISGTPVEVIESPGREITVKAVDAFGSEGFQTVTFIINATVGSIEPPTQSRENIFATQPMTATTITSTPNLVAPLTWAISSGTLPTGLNFNTSTGVISGTPTEVIAAPGRQVVVRATDVGGLQGFQTVTFQINPAPELYAFTTATFTTGGATGRNGPTVTQARSGVGNPSWAASYLNMTTAGIQDWTVPKTGSYTITCLGARGGQAGSNSGGWGFGARAIGTFSFIQGEVLRIVVGQKGVDTVANGNRCSTGGGGASAVWKRDSTAEPLIVAGGGAGSSDQPEGNAGVGGQRHARVHAVAGTTAEGATNSSGNVRISGGSGGNGGNTLDSPSAGAGGGYKSNGSASNSGDRSGKQLRTDARGGEGGSDGNRGNNGDGLARSQGGFGGGGGGEGWYGCSGGGGGYSGGSATADTDRTAGGGGSSYNAGTSQTMNAAFNNNIGQVIITRL
jgi:hypothetical protein